MTIGQHINLAKNNKGMTLKELANKSMVCEGTIASWIYHGHIPSVDLLICVADALEISLDELVGRGKQ